MKENCKYRLPCGWCDKRNKECEMVRSEDFGAVTKVSVPLEHHDNSISASQKRCRNCENATVTISTVLQYKCLLTGRVHFGDDQCDCNTITAHNSPVLEDRIV